MLAPQLSSMIIDNLRQSNWLQVLRPTFLSMSTGEMKIPNIKQLPSTVMHVPGQAETPTEPVITAAVLSAKTLLTLVEVANELLDDSIIAHNAIMQACTSSLSNKLLQQVLYGNGTGPQMKGLTLYDETAFADAGPMDDVKDIYSLATRARVAILKNNGTLDGLLYSPDLEPRLNKRLATGELIQPSRMFSELLAAGRVMPHPSVGAGDMIFAQSDALIIGVREQLRIETDTSSSFNSFNTKFRLVMRADIFVNAPHVVYYHNIPDDEPAA